MNRVVLVGRLTAKPELRYTASNLAYTRFSIAVDRYNSTTHERTADFINCVAWRNQAENLCKYIDKGGLIALDGRIQTGSYERDGQTRYTTDVVADRIEFLGSRNSNYNQTYSTPSPTQSTQTKEPSPYDFEPSSTKPEVNVDADPFADFGDNVSIDDNFLD